MQFISFLPQAVKPVQNGVKLTENGHKKSEDDDKEMQLQAAADVDIFRQVNIVKKCEG